MPKDNETRKADALTRKVEAMSRREARELVELVGRLHGSTLLLEVVHAHLGEYSGSGRANAARVHLARSIKALQGGSLLP